MGSICGSSSSKKYKAKDKPEPQQVQVIYVPYPPQYPPPPGQQFYPPNPNYANANPNPNFAFYNPNYAVPNPNQNHNSNPIQSQMVSQKQISQKQYSNPNSKLQTNPQTQPSNPNSIYQTNPQPQSLDQNLSTNQSNALQSNKIPSQPKSNHQSPEKSSQRSEALEMLEIFKKTLVKMVGVAEGKHMGIHCDVCMKGDFKGFRYKCLTCPDYDLCDLCFEKKRSNKNHERSHPMFLLQDPNFKTALEPLVTMGLGGVNKACVDQGIEHKGFTCNCCHEAIEGIRLQCDECLDYDQCYQCYKQKKLSEKHLSGHPMIVVLAPVDYEIPHKEIEFGEVLGQGSFGKTFKAVWNERVIACKVLDFSILKPQSEKDMDKLAKQIISFQNEMRVYKELCSSHIIRYIGEADAINLTINSLGDPNICKQMVICLEFMENGTVWDQILIKKKDLSLRKRFQLCLGLASGLRRIHSKNIVHKDLKPDNIFLNKDWEIKIGDLGLAFNKQISKELKEVKQQIYYPPEEKVSKNGDIYSTGLIINEIFTGCMHNPKVLFDVEPKSKFFFDVVEKCLDEDPEKRPLAEQIEDRFLNFVDFFWKFIKNNSLPYSDEMGNEDKNKIFIICYIAFLQEYGTF